MNTKTLVFKGNQENDDSHAFPMDFSVGFFLCPCISHATVLSRRTLWTASIGHDNKKLRISALVKIDFGYFLKNVKHRGL